MLFSHLLITLFGWGKIPYLFLPMTDRIRIIKHEAVPDCGSFEVRFIGGRPSQYFYWDDLPGRRLRREVMTRAEALAAARSLARTLRDQQAG